MTITRIVLFLALGFSMSFALFSCSGAASVGTAPGVCVRATDCEQGQDCQGGFCISVGRGDSGGQALDGSVQESPVGQDNAPVAEKSVEQSPCVPVGQEVCDGKDNDCDGKIDESFPKKGETCRTGVAGPCGVGEVVCASGKVVCHSVRAGVKEDCGNQLDDNCDGRINEGCVVKCSGGADPKTYYRDVDRDGFGDDKASIKACVRPQGFVERGGDCDDANERVRPDQTDFFDRPGSGGSFDYNCDGKSDRRYPEAGRCEQGCRAKRGFIGGRVPACGEKGRFLKGCQRDGSRCKEDVEDERQECR